MHHMHGLRLLMDTVGLAGKIGIRAPIDCLCLMAAQQKQSDVGSAEFQLGIFNVKVEFGRAAPLQGLPASGNG